MIYNNLLLFLVAIFLFSIDTIPEQPILSPWLAMSLFVAIVFGFDLVSRQLYRRPTSLTSAGYFWVEKRLSILSLLAFGGVLYLCDAKYHLSFLSFGDRLPALVNIAGLVVFLFFLSLMWRAARRNYQHVFGRHYTAPGFVLSNIKANLPIVLPWVILSMGYDLLLLIPSARLRTVLNSEWGDLVFFGFFLLFVVLFFPPLVRRLWGCSVMPEGELKDQLLAFCRKQDFSAGLYLWPLFEGRVLTAGVMGIVPGLRYVLLTPAIINAMTIDELESVMAHEIGHVKWHHLLKYLFLIVGFSVFIGFLAQPLFYLLVSQGAVIKLITASGLHAEIVLVTMIVIFMVIYFRFIFGYYIRNFERQADLHVLGAVGDGRALVSAFEKISDMSGNIRNQKNWHHFGIGERIDCIEEAENDPGVVERHNKKVRYSLFAYIFIMALGVLIAWQSPTDKLYQQYTDKHAEAIILQHIKEEPENGFWHHQLGNFMLTKKMEAEALTAYEKALSLEPADAEVLNNLAWLLLTSEDLSLRDPPRALNLARTAATRNPNGHILDTLATAYWAAGLTEEAVETLRQAAMADPEKTRFYQVKAQGFLEFSYSESVKKLETAENKKFETVEEQ